MNLPPDRWRRIDEVFTAALEKPFDEREAFVHAACGDDADLFREVLDLLKSQDDARDVLGESATGFMEPLMPGLQDHLDRAGGLVSGAVVGAYRVERELGRGGMGAVYLAERADGHVEQRVALKLIKRGMDTDDILRRFRRERQILASLEHPNIARFLDAGATEDGRPYLALEHVAGQAIDQFCDERRLNIEARLLLFQNVCKTVQYAHQNLIVHRDLKPSNILVTEEGMVKLLDFGIARLLDTDNDEQTREGSRIMTPEYAAPEQISGAAVTTLSDVYALGVVLYELLTGHRARDRRQVSPPAGIEAPEHPSAAVSRPLERRGENGSMETLTPDVLSARRDAKPEELQRRLRGDLDMIMLKALHPEPERRYASAEAFLEDIKRHLAGLPVLAQPDSISYRLRKFVRRNRIPVVAVLLALVSLSTGLGIARWQASEARFERDAAETVSGYIESLFDASDPFLTTESERLDTLRVNALLDFGARQVRNDLANRPLVQARMLNVLGNVQSNLGQYDVSLPLLEEALAIQVEKLGVNHADVAETRHNLASVYHALGRFAMADSLYQQVLKVREIVFGNAHALTIETVLGLATVFHEQGRYDEAEGLYRRAQDELQVQGETSALQLANVQIRMAELLRDRGNYEIAIQKLRDIQVPEVDASGKALLLEARRLDALGVVFQLAGNLEEAGQAFQSALEQAQLRLPDDHPRVTEIMGNQALLYRDLGDFDSSIELSRSILDLRRERYGFVHPEVEKSLNNLAWVLYVSGRSIEAEPISREALSASYVLYGEKHQIIADRLLNLGGIMLELNRLDDAERYYVQAIEMETELLGPAHPTLDISRSHLAQLMRRRKNFVEAEAIYRDLVALKNKRGDEVGEAILSSLLAQVVREAGDFEEAVSIYRGTLDLMEQVFDADHLRIGLAQLGLGTALMQLKRFEEAEVHLLEGERILKENEVPYMAIIYSRLASLYEEWGKKEKAADYQSLIE